MDINQKSPALKTQKEKVFDLWFSEILLFAGAILTGLSFFLIRNLSTYFTVLTVIGLLCFGFSCIGYVRLKELLRIK